MPFLSGVSLCYFLLHSLYAILLLLYLYAVVNAVCSLCHDLCRPLSMPVVMLRCHYAMGSAGGSLCHGTVVGPSCAKILPTPPRRRFLKMLIKAKT